MNQNYDEVIRSLIKKVNTLETEQKRLAAQRPLYTILNVNSPAALTGSVNNYDPGDYDFLNISSTLAVNITGIAGGVAGRVLFLQSGSAFNITLVHQSGSSVAANRFSCPGTVNHIMTPNSTGTNNRVILVYNLNRWCIIAESDAT